MGRRSRDPRRVSGAGVVGPGGPQDRDAVLVDTTNSVLLDHMTVTLMEAVSNGIREEDPRWVMSLAGRINKTVERAEVVFMFDEDGAAAIVSQLLGLASRMGRYDELAQLISARMEQMEREGAL